MAEKAFTKEDRKAAMERIERRHRNELAQLRRSRFAHAPTIPVTISCRDPWMGADCSLEFVDAEEEPMLFFEDITGSFFVSTYSRVIQAEYHTNRRFAECGDVTLGDYLTFMGLDPIKLVGDDGFKKGWDVDCGIYWVDFHHEKRTNAKGERYYSISPQFSPEVLDENDEMM